MPRLMCLSDLGHDHRDLLALSKWIGGLDVINFQVNTNINMVNFKCLHISSVITTFVYTLQLGKPSLKRLFQKLSAIRDIL